VHVPRTVGEATAGNNSARHSQHTRFLSHRRGAQQHCRGPPRVGLLGPPEDGPAPRRAPPAACRRGAPPRAAPASLAPAGARRAFQAPAVIGRGRAATTGCPGPPRGQHAPHAPAPGRPRAGIRRRPPRGGAPAKGLKGFIDPSHARQGGADKRGGRGRDLRLERLLARAGLGELLRALPQRALQLLRLPPQLRRERLVRRGPSAPLLVLVARRRQRGVGRRQRCALLGLFALRALALVVQRVARRLRSAAAVCSLRQQLLDLCAARLEVVGEHLGLLGARLRQGDVSYIHVPHLLGVPRLVEGAAGGCGGGHGGSGENDARPMAAARPPCNEAGAASRKGDEAQHGNRRGAGGGQQPAAPSAAAGSQRRASRPAAAGPVPRSPRASRAPAAPPSRTAALQAPPPRAPRGARPPRAARAAARRPLAARPPPATARGSRSRAAPRGRLSRGRRPTQRLPAPCRAPRSSVRGARAPAWRLPSSARSRSGAA